MKHFAMCEECAAEYHDPKDRRFHAQPNACSRCGPHVELFDGRELLERNHRAVALAAHMIRVGAIVAMKGIGGFHLLADASNDEAVQTLRRRKHREEKPFALLFPSLDAVRSACNVADLEEQLLCSPQAPIVLLERLHQRSSIAPSVAPNNPNLGIMLPHSPLHHVLMRELEFPMVATSGNLSNEPICIDEREARERLRGLADFFLVHNRPIVRHADDSIVRATLGREMVMRGGRGYAPICIPTRKSTRTILAVGGHLKNTVGLKRDDAIVISQHIGDLETKEAHCAFEKIAADLQNFYETAPDVIACDLHPDYSSTAYARERGVRVIAVQHHYAHVLSCLADNQLETPALGIAWDGTGLGTDGTIWGSEFLLINGTDFERVAHLRTFRLPGGDTAIKFPFRSAFALLYEIFSKESFLHSELGLFANHSKDELTIIRQMLDCGTNAPVTSSIGRLFDAVASLIGLRQKSNFEGQAAMELEFAASADTTDVYPFLIREGKPLIIDWEPTIRAIVDDVRQHAAVKIIATKFHNTLAEMVVQVCERIGEETIALSGGCFQNKQLLTRAVTQLKAHGFNPVWHRNIPTNDGGIALGQIMAADSIGGAS